MRRLHVPASLGTSGESKTFRRFADIMDRIEALRTHLGLNKSQFSRSINMKPQTYNNFIGSQCSKPNVELLYGVVAKFGANPMWILTGRGEMFTGGADGRPGWTPAGRPRTGDNVSGLKEDGMMPESLPEAELNEPILRRLEEKFDSLDREFSPLLDRLMFVLKRYSHVNPAGSASELREFLEHIEQRVPLRPNQGQDT